MKAGRSLLLSVFFLTVVLPFAWVIFNSFKEGTEILDKPWSLPSYWAFENYANAWNKADIGKFFLNSVLVTLGTMAILIPVSAMAAYVLAKFPFRGSNGVLTCFSSGMMIPQFLAIVPLFMLTQKLHLYDTRIGLILVYVAFSLPFTIFVLYGFFQNLPDELIEASHLDGAGHGTTFWRVMLPLARPGILVALIFNAIGLWNEYSLALVLMPTYEQQTLPVGLAKISMTQQYQSDWGALFAGMVIVMGPILLLYSLFREKIHETMLAGALKG
jgi:N-acetylglucosamine transport system permease protein